MTCNGIIITKWQNDYKKGFQISDTHFFGNELIITKWRNDYKKGLRISDSHFFLQWNHNYKENGETI